MMFFLDQWHIIVLLKSLIIHQIYEYHRNNGFVCILLNEIFELMYVGILFE